MTNLMMKCRRCGDTCEYDGEIPDDIRDEVFYVEVNMCSECYDEEKDAKEIITTYFFGSDENFLMVSINVPYDSIEETELVEI